MKPSIIFAFLAAATGLALSGGCAATGPTPLSASIRRFDHLDPRTAFDAAASALSEHGFVIDERDPGEGTLRTAPRELSGRGRSIGLADVFGGSRARREVVTARVTGEDDGVSAYCRVEVQEGSTEARRLYAGEHAMSDLPTDTPIDREGATSEEQNTVWRIVGRDRAKERAILDTMALMLQE